MADQQEFTTVAWDCPKCGANAGKVKIPQETFQTHFIRADGLDIIICTRELPGSSAIKCEYCSSVFSIMPTKSVKPFKEYRGSTYNTTIIGNVDGPVIQGDNNVIIMDFGGFKTSREIKPKCRMLGGCDNPPVEGSSYCARHKPIMDRLK